MAYNDWTWLSFGKKLRSLHVLTVCFTSLNWAIKFYGSHIKGNRDGKIRWQNSVITVVALHVVPLTSLTILCLLFATLFADEPTEIRDRNERCRSDTSGRSAALERAYVHDVYENCDEAAGQIRPRVAQFLANLEPGSVVCDVGCGNGRYLSSFNFDNNKVYFFCNFLSKSSTQHIGIISHSYFSLYEV
jgi:hypothetical protein